MIDEKAALRGAEKAIGQSVEDVAIAFPVGTTRAQAEGELGGEAVGAAGGVIASLSGSGVAGAAAGGGGVGMLLAQRRLEKTEPAASIVLALTKDNLYLLGRHRLGVLASFKDLEIIHKIPRDQANVQLSPAGFTSHLEIVDEEDGAQYLYEVKPLGSGIKQLLADLDKENA